MANRKIENLSKEEQVNLANDYLNKSEITLELIIDKYDLDLKKNEIVKFLPEQETTMLCPYCNVNMFAKIKNRSEMNEPYCKVCGHVYYAKESHYWRKQRKCSCENCCNLELEIQKGKRALIESTYKKNYEKVNFCELDFEKQWSLVKMILHSSSDFRILNAYKLDFDDYDYCSDIKNLHSEKILSVSSLSDIEAFKECDEFPNVFYTSQVIYDVNVNFSEEEIALIRSNKYFCKSINTSDKIELLHKIMHEDVMERFEALMNERGLGFEIMVSAETEFKELYNKLSYGQIVNLCYQVSKFYLDKTKTGKIYKSVVPKCAIKTAITFYKNSIEKGWAINNSEVSYAGAELKDYITDVLGKDIIILQSVITEDMLYD